jgi:hypothetical protein
MKALRFFETSGVDAALYPRKMESPAADYLKYHHTSKDIVCAMILSCVVVVTEHVLAFTAFFSRPTSFWPVV